MPLFTDKELEEQYFDRIESRTYFFPRGVHRAVDTGAYVIQSPEEKEAAFNFLRKEFYYFTAFFLFEAVIMSICISFFRPLLTIIVGFLVFFFYDYRSTSRHKKLFKGVSPIKIQKEYPLSKLLDGLGWKSWLYSISLVALTIAIVILMQTLLEN